jgi:integrase
MSKRRGQGHVYRPTYKDRRTGKVKRQRVWWVKYSIDGEAKFESSKSEKHADAVALLNQRLTERGRGISRRDLEKVRIKDLAELIRADYRKQAEKIDDPRKRQRKLTTLDGRLKHLEPIMAWKAVDVQEDVIDRLAVDLLDGGLKSSTVNRVLSTLRRMFNLGRRAKMVGRVPVIEKLEERNTRKGFVDDKGIAEIEAELPDDTEPIAEAGYVTGARKDELLSRKWHHVDFDAGWLRFEPGETKNNQGRNFPLIPRLRAVLERQHKRKQEIERRTGRIIDAVFFRDNGEPIKDFRGAWEGACVRAGFGRWKDPENRSGYSGTLFHDLRRSAVRNLVRAGIPQVVAQQLTGHLTASIFKRYAIVDESMLQEAGEKLSDFYFAESFRRSTHRDLKERNAQGSRA